jgi:hypothetical protein
VTYGAGLFVAVGAFDGVDAYIVTSPDGLTWTERESPSNVQKTNITYGSGLFVSTSTTVSPLLISSNALDWYEVPHKFNADLTGLCYANGLFIIVGSPLASGAAILKSLTVPW